MKPAEPPAIKLVKGDFFSRAAILVFLCVVVEVGGRGGKCVCTVQEASRQIQVGLTVMVKRRKEEEEEE